ncbi:EpsG family protein [Sporosarcina sp. P29]|uniref:EpsG family protein n=1 Tax=Sporosarcina sp. P29 TaxID=2048252 RepID=UPI0034CE553F
MIGLFSIGYNVLKVSNKNNEKIKSLFVLFATSLLIIVLSLRSYTIGADVPTYLTYFSSMSQYSTFDSLMLGHRFESGYKILNKLISIFTTNNQLFLMVIACIAIIPIGITIYKHSKMPFLSFTLYITLNYYSFTFSGLRQAISYAIIFNSYSYIQERKIFKFILSVLIASLFHQSALIFLPAYFLVKIKINKFTIISILLFNVMIFTFRQQIFAIFINFFYEDYGIVESKSFKWMLLCALIVIVGLFFYKKVISISQSNNALYILLIIGVSLMIFALVGTNIMRISNYYYMFVILFIPEIINVIKDKRLVLLIVYVLIVLNIIIYIWFLNIDGFNIVPYKFFWT